MGSVHDPTLILHQTECSVTIYLVPTDSLYPGKRLVPGDSIYSLNHRTRFTLQEDGNLVYYGVNNSVLWTSRTDVAGKHMKEFILREDGNVVLYDKTDGIMWQLYTTAIGARLTISDDANMILHGNGFVFWGFWYMGTRVPSAQNSIIGKGNFLFIANAPTISFCVLVRGMD